VLCPHCQAPNADDSRFCGVCGQATQATVPSSPSLGEAPTLIGRVIAGRYRVLAKLGEGGMGTVFQAEQISLKRTVAIKLLRPDVSASAMLLRRFNAEAEAVAKLRHPNTVNIYDFGQDTDGALFIAMELIEGQSLRTVVHREAPLPPARALAIAAQVAASLADAHAKTIIHRDLKPDNVMLTDRGRSKDNVTVLDFGIAKLRDESRGTQQAMTQAGDMLGTPQYMAPEQIRGEQIDGRTDVYALGCMLYEMVTARMPYEAPTVMALLSKHLLEQAPPPSQRRPELGIPPAVDDLVMSAMAKDAAARPPTMEDYGERIAAVLAALPQEGAQRAAAVSVPTPHADTPLAYSAAVGNSGGFAPQGGPASGPPSGPAMSPTPPGGAGGSGPLRPHTPTPPPPGFGFGPPGPPPGPGFGAPGSPVYPQPPFGGPHAGPPFGPPGPGYPPPHATPPYPHAPPHGPAPSGGSSKVVWALVAVLLLGGGGAGIYFATRGSPAKPTPEAREEPERPEPDKPDPGKREPDKWDRKPSARADDPDDGDDHDSDSDSHDHDDSNPAGVDGTPVEVVQGVKIIAPPGMAVNRQKDGSVIIGDPRTFAIAAGPISYKTNDPDAIARAYSKESGLSLLKSESGPVAGAARKIYAFSGKLYGTPVFQVAIPLVGRGYRVAVIIQMPPASVQDATVQATLGDVITRRIIVPSDNP